jgi:hypothetical protein
MRKCLPDMFRTPPYLALQEGIDLVRVQVDHVRPPPPAPPL